MANPPIVPDRLTEAVWDAQELAERAGCTEVAALTRVVNAALAGWKLALREAIYQIEHCTTRPVFNPELVPDQVVASLWDLRRAADEAGLPAVVAIAGEALAAVEGWQAAMHGLMAQVFERRQPQDDPDGAPSPWFERQRRETGRVQQLVSLDAERARRRRLDRVA